MALLGKSHWSYTQFSSEETDCTSLVPERGKKENSQCSAPLQSISDIDERLTGRLETGHVIQQCEFIACSSADQRDGFWKDDDEQGVDVPIAGSTLTCSCGGGDGEYRGVRDPPDHPDRPGAELRTAGEA